MSLSRSSSCSSELPLNQAIIAIGLLVCLNFSDLSIGQILPTSPSKKRQQTNSRLTKGSVNSGNSAFGRPQTQRREKWNVEVEVFFRGNLRPRGGLQWLKILRESGCSNASLRSKRGDETVTIQESKNFGRPTRKVLAEVSGGQLFVPGHRFSLNQKREVKQWIDSLRFPPKAPEPKPAAFGLNEVELVAVHLKLGKALPRSTQKMTSDQVLLSLKNASPYPLKLSDQQLRQIIKEEVPPIELKGISTGTALAAYLRPYGLVFFPEKDARGRIRLTVAPSSKAKEYWPVGWPAPGLPVNRAPKIFQSFLPDPNQKTIQQAMFDISQKSGVPILLDHNTLLPSGFDAEVRKRIFKGKKEIYRTAIDLWWRNGKKIPVVEIRMDESENSFLWISGNQ